MNNKLFLVNQKQRATDISEKNYAAGGNDISAS